MKLLNTVLISLALPVTLLQTSSGWAADDVAVFICAEVDGRLATAVKTENGNVPVIYWDSKSFTGSGFSPAVRCKQVTDRFTNLYTNGQLKYLATGRIRRQSVICGLEVGTAKCNKTNVLFTLKPGSDPRNVLRQINAVRNRAAGSAAVQENSGGILRANPSTDIQVDMEDWLTFAKKMHFM
jgi:hypothetical protein